MLHLPRYMEKEKSTQKKSGAKDGQAGAVARLKKTVEDDNRIKELNLAFSARPRPPLQGPTPSQHTRRCSMGGFRFISSTETIVGSILRTVTVILSQNVLRVYWRHSKIRGF